MPESTRKGLRKDTTAIALIPLGRDFFDRLAEHAESIRPAADLELADFRCRFLVANVIWIPLGESLRIQQYTPVWNRDLPGFGNHDPGSGR